MTIKNRKGGSSFLSLCTVGFSFLPLGVGAATVSLEAVNSGYYTINGSGNGNRANSAIWGDTIRDWVGFDLTGVTGPINSATLQVWSDSRNASGQTINWWDVTTPYSSLGTVNGAAVFNDLGSGTLFGQGPQTHGALNSYGLNPAAISSLTASQGSKWAIGGQEATGSGYAFGYLGGVSVPNSPIRLVLDVPSSPPKNVPQPGSPVTYITLNAVNSGYYTFYGVPDGSKANPAIWGDTIRGWLGFDLSGLDGVITSASLQVWSDRRNASGQTVNWWSVDTPYNDLGTATGTGIFSDIGSGLLLGQGQQLSGALNSYELNPDALSELNAAEGSKWAIGGQEFSGGGYAHAFLSGVNSPNNPIRLVLGIQPRASNVPEPGSPVIALGIALCSLVGFHKMANRRKSANAPL